MLVTSSYWIKIFIHYEMLLACRTSHYFYFNQNILQRLLQIFKTHHIWTLKGMSSKPMQIFEGLEKEPLMREWNYDKVYDVIKLRLKEVISPFEDKS